MKLMRFLVELQPADRTTCFQEAEFFRQQLQSFAEALMRFHTMGPIPGVKVFCADDCELVDSEALAVLQTKAHLKR